MKVEVECYAGCKADERPLRFHRSGRTMQVQTVLSQWYEPGAAFFRVRTEEGTVHILRRGSSGEWNERPIAGVD